MGAVYRAHDPRLRRDVAIKVLRIGRTRRSDAAAAVRTGSTRGRPPRPPEHHCGPRHRQLRGSPYIVTELLEGTTLREKMGGRPMPVRKAVDYRDRDRSRPRCRARARHRPPRHQARKRVHHPRGPSQDSRFRHRQAHRCRRTPTTRAADADGCRTRGRSAPRRTCRRNRRAAYRADHRADLFSLGVVLYEMVTGVAPFRRDTAAETMTAILREERRTWPRSIACPTALQRILQHCLEKDPNERFQSARDLVFSLEAAVDGKSTPPRSGRPFANRTVLAALAATALVSSVIAALVTAQRTAVPSARHEVSGIYRFTDFNGLEEFPAISPDQKSVAFTARVGGFRQIYVRLMAGGTPLQITKDAADHQLPRWTPRRERDHLLFAGGSRRNARDDLGDPRPRRRAATRDRQRRRRRHRCVRPDCLLQAVRRSD